MSRPCCALTHDSMCSLARPEAQTLAFLLLRLETFAPSVCGLTFECIKGQFHAKHLILELAGKMLPWCAAGLEGPNVSDAARRLERQALQVQQVVEVITLFKFTCYLHQNLIKKFSFIKQVI